MSRSTNYSFTCPCGTVFTSQIYEYVNVAQDPRLRYTVLAGLLNVSTCPNCGRR
ncbi:MAG: CpXC domain-containing protein, partial [Ktedonobacteraceae bacterium]